MKRIFAFLLVLCVCLTIISCKDSEHKDSEHRDSEHKDSEHTDSDIDKTEVETQEVPQLADGEWEFPYNHLDYMPFEDMLMGVTDVIIGEYSGTSQKGQLLYYNFYVVESLRGGDITNRIEVESLAARSYDTESDTYISTEVYEPEFDGGRRYLLLLKRSSPSVYEDGGDTYSFAFDAVIPIDALESVPPRTDEMVLAWDVPLINHLKLESTYRALMDGSFVDYILDAVKDNPYSYDSGYIQETDIESVILGSQYVFEVRVDSLFLESYTGDRITYNCTLIDTYLGETEQERVTVVFPIDKVQIGDTCIVAVNDRSGYKSFFTMSSKNSVFDVSQRDEILDILGFEKKFNTVLYNVSEDIPFSLSSATDIFGVEEFDKKDAPRVLQVDILGTTYELSYANSAKLPLTAFEVDVYTVDGLENSKILIDPTDGRIVEYINIPYSSTMSKEEDYISFMCSVMGFDIDTQEYSYSCKSHLYTFSDKGVSSKVKDGFITCAENQKLGSYSFYFTKQVNGINTLEHISAEFREEYFVLEISDFNYEDSMFLDIVDEVDQLEKHNKIYLQSVVRSDLSIVKNTVAGKTLFMRDGVAYILSTNLATVTPGGVDNGYEVLVQTVSRLIE